MDLQQQLSLSYYKEISDLNPKHKISVVQHRETKRIYVKKILDIYNRSVYDYLKQNHVRGIPTIYELFEDGNQLILIEEYISGETLESIINRTGPLAYKDIIKYTIQLCNIISGLHNCSPAIIHRDIKPSNIIITPEDNVVLLDLNAAKYMNPLSTEDTTLLGTKGYAAPEQYGFGSSNTRTDIYAIGMLMNTMSLGSFSPFVCQSNLQPIISKCIEMNPYNRYSSVEELKNSLLSLDTPLVQRKYLKSWMRFLPPGFRNMNPFHIILACLGYAFIFWLSLTLEDKNSGTMLLVAERILCLFIFLSLVACTFNYLDIHSRIPFCHSSKKWLRLLGILLLDVIVILCEVVVVAMVISFIA